MSKRKIHPLDSGWTEDQKLEYTWAGKKFDVYPLFDDGPNDPCRDELDFKTKLDDGLNYMISLRGQYDFVAQRYWVSVTAEGRWNDCGRGYDRMLKWYSYAKPENFSLNRVMGSFMRHASNRIKIRLEHEKRQAEFAKKLKFERDVWEEYK